MKLFLIKAMYNRVSTSSNNLVMSILSFKLYILSIKLMRYAYKLD